MEPNVYAPPEADLQEVIERTPRPKTAVLAAALFDLVTTIALTTLVGIGYGIYLASQGATPAEIQASAEGLQSHSGFRYSLLGLGELISVVAGYLCARLAVRNVYRYALLSALLLALVGRLIRLDPGLDPTDLGLSALTLAAYLLGAHLYLRRAKASLAGSRDAD